MRADAHCATCEAMAAATRARDARVDLLSYDPAFSAATRAELLAAVVAALEAEADAWSRLLEIDRGDMRRADLDSRLGDALRASGISAADALAVQALYATAGQSGSHRIVSALRAIEAWVRGGAL